jgi:hypothetical protein
MLEADAGVPASEGEPYVPGRCLGALATAGLALVVMATPTTAQTIFSGFPPGSIKTYTEIYSDVPNVIVAVDEAQAQSGSAASNTVECVPGTAPTASPFNNCGVEYHGFQTFDFDAKGDRMVGIVRLDQGQIPPTLTPGGLQSQAAVWVPSQNGGAGIVLLSDGSLDFLNDPSHNDVESSINYNFTGIPYQYGSYAFDITADASLIVGMSDGYTSARILGAQQAAIGPFGPILPTQHWYLPLYWTSPDGTQWTEGTVLSMLSGGAVENDYPRPIGGAIAVSDGVDVEGNHHIVGWNGNLASNGAARFVQAVIWNGPTANPISLGWLQEPPGPSGRNPYSVANDVNDLSQVVGWSGNLASIPFRDIILNGYMATIDPAYSANGSWQPQPFVWTPELAGLDDVETYGSAGMQPLEMYASYDGNMTLNAVDIEQNEYQYGEARAIANGTATSNGGDVAVGWVAHDDGEGGIQTPIRAAAWLNTYNDIPPDIYEVGEDYPDWYYSTLVLLPTPSFTSTCEGCTDPANANAIANAVDASGGVAVGKVFYSVPHVDGVPPPNSAAAYWLIGYDIVDGHLVQAPTVQEGLVEQALADAGVPMDDKHLTLTDATGVRVVLNPDGTVQEIYVAGTGEGSFGSWIASLVNPGLGNAPSLARSLAVVGQGARDINEGIAFNAENERCWRPEGQSVDEAPWCFFTVGRGSLYVDRGANGTALGQQVGIARFLDEDTQIGGSFGFNEFNGNTPAGTYSATLLGGGVYIAHEPDEGLRGVASAAIGRVVDARFTRTFDNGVGGTSSSTGRTDGWAYALYGKLAYSMMVKEGVRVIPFVSASASHATLAGFTDTGPTAFNATIASFSTDNQVLTAGIRAEQDLNPQRMIYGELSLWAIHSSGGSVNGTFAAGLLSLSTPTPSGWGTLASATAGIKQEFDASTNGFAQVTLSSNFGSYVSAAVVGGFNKSF